MFRKFEYKIFNMSEVSYVDDRGLYQTRYENGKEITLIDVLNKHGRDGWQILFPITSTKQSYLMMREAKDV